VIDHFMYGVPDLEEGLRWAKATFGITPARGGSHPSLGTCNALLSLGSTYLEIIAPDREQTLAGTFGSRLATLNTGGLITWAARGDLRRISQTLSDRGIESAGPVPTSRKTPEGQTLAWELLFPRRHAFGGLFPFFIDWLKCEHPSSTSPTAGTLVSFVVSTPNAPTYVNALRGLVIDQSVHQGEPGLRVDIEVGDRHVTLVGHQESLSMRSFA
jgi:Glyoxalase-like domain